MTPAEMVREFHQAFNIPISKYLEADPPESRLRIKLLLEEVSEYILAIGYDNIEQVADALGDIVYVCYGSALSHGINLDAIIKEIHHSNMTKLDENSDPIAREDGKIIKSNLYQPPNILKVLNNE